MSELRVLGEVRLNGERYVRVGTDRQPGLALFHENAAAEVAALLAWDGNRAAPAADWTMIYRSGGVSTARMKVPGGWLVKHASDLGLAMAFVPDPKHTWKTQPIDPTA